MSTLTSNITDSTICDIYPIRYWNGSYMAWLQHCYSVYQSLYITYNFNHDNGFGRDLYYSPCKCHIMILSYIPRDLQSCYPVRIQLLKVVSDSRVGGIGSVSVVYQSRLSDSESHTAPLNSWDSNSIYHSKYEQYHNKDLLRQHLSKIYAEKSRSF